MIQKYQLLLITAIAVIAFLVGLAIGSGSRQPTDLERRLQYVRVAIQSGVPTDTVILGDSIGESVAWDCGRTFNASVAGATLQDIAPLAPLAARHLQPKTTIVEVGANQFKKGKDPTFAASYLNFVRSIKGRLILVGVPNRRDVNAIIRATAAKVGAPFVEPVAGELTSDRLHPNVRGATLLRERAAVLCQ